MMMGRGGGFYLLPKTPSVTISDQSSCIQRKHQPEQYQSLVVKMVDWQWSLWEHWKCHTRWKWHYWPRHLPWRVERRVQSETFVFLVFRQYHVAWPRVKEFRTWPIYSEIHLVFLLCSLQVASTPWFALVSLLWFELVQAFWRCVVAWVYEKFVVEFLSFVSIVVSATTPPFLVLSYSRYSLSCPGCCWQHMPALKQFTFHSNSLKNFRLQDEKIFYNLR